MEAGQQGLGLVDAAPGESDGECAMFIFLYLPVLEEVGASF
jgi:hypothetical protein